MGGGEGDNLPVLKKILRTLPHVKFLYTTPALKNDLINALNFSTNENMNVFLKKKTNKQTRS